MHNAARTAAQKPETKTQKDPIALLASLEAACLKAGLKWDERGALAAQVRAVSDSLRRERPRLFAGGVLRYDGDELLLLNRRDRGLGEYAVPVTWDSLFRHYDVTVGAPQVDEHGQYWPVIPGGAA